jgi:hypothetical protein
MALKLVFINLAFGILGLFQVTNNNIELKILNLMQLLIQKVLVIQWR